MMRYNYNLICIALFDYLLDECKILIILIVYVLWNHTMLVIKDLRVIDHAILNCKLIKYLYFLTTVLKG